MGGVEPIDAERVRCPARFEVTLVGRARARQADARQAYPGQARDELALPRTDPLLQGR